MPHSPLALVRDDPLPGGRLPGPAPDPEFERVLRPHLSAAHHLARWLTRSAADAEDALQEALLRAFRSFDRPMRPRAWLLRIVRNCCYDQHVQRGRTRSEPLDEESLPPDAAMVLGLAGESPEARLLRMADGRALEEALRALAPEFREAFVLREVEELSYKEIAEVTDVPIGTVMSRLSRARGQLRELIAGRQRKESA